ncbi:MAG: peroxiredoxin [Actinomycetaceae bacterium]|nr:peroxiredoxin [Actinomycetaceae bacterium]
MKLEIGEKAPAFALATAGGGEITLEQLLQQSEKGVIVYFYPRASTPGCTTQACDFRDSLASLRAHGYEVVGISPDKIAALDKFAAKYDLPFTLAADPEKTTLDAYGAYGEKNLYGKLTRGVIRSTVVVGKNGKVVLARYNVRAKGHVARLTKELGIV